MESILKAAQRKWSAEEHLKIVLEGAWMPLHDEAGNELKGIRGRIGAASMSMSGHEIGVDLIEMQPGSAFPLHVHPGDHILYIESGEGIVHIRGRDRTVRKGDTVFIAAEHPHGVRVPVPGATESLVLLAFGHPHKHVSATDRMHEVDYE